MGVIWSVTSSPAISPPSAAGRMIHFPRHSFAPNSLSAAGSPAPCPGTAYVWITAGTCGEPPSARSPSNSTDVRLGRYFGIDGFIGVSDTGVPVERRRRPHARIPQPAREIRIARFVIEGPTLHRPAVRRRRAALVEPAAGVL